MGNHRINAQHCISLFKRGTAHESLTGTNRDKLGHCPSRITSETPPLFANKPQNSIWFPRITLYNTAVEHITDSSLSLSIGTRLLGRANRQECQENHRPSWRKREERVEKGTWRNPSRRPEMQPSPPSSCARAMSSPWRKNNKISDKISMAGVEPGVVSPRWTSLCPLVLPAWPSPRSLLARSFSLRSKAFKTPQASFPLGISWFLSLQSTTEGATVCVTLGWCAPVDQWMAVSKAKETHVGGCTMSWLMWHTAWFPWTRSIFPCEPGNLIHMIFAS